MDWDFGDDVETGTEPAAEGRELLPEGRHELQIVRVENADGRLVVSLAHDDKRWSWVWFQPQVGAKWAKPIVASLAKSLGLTRDGWLASDPTEHVGRRVAADVYHKVAANGRTYVNVSKFHEAAPVKPAATKAPPRTAAQKDDARMKEQYADDIPF